MDIPRTGHSCNRRSRATFSTVKGLDSAACVFKAKMSIIVPVATKPTSTPKKVVKTLSAGILKKDKLWDENVSTRQWRWCRILIYDDRRRESSFCHDVNALTIGISEKWV